MLSGTKSSGRASYALTLKNVSAMGSLSGFQVQFNKNALGLAPGTTEVGVDAIARGQEAEVSLPVVFSGEMLSGAPGDDLQVALKVAQLGVLFFVDKVPQTMGM